MTNFEFDSNKIELPASIDLTPKGELVDRASLGEDGYIENVEYTLTINFFDNKALIDYYGEDNTYLSDVVEDWHLKLPK
jgi:hypothetical protein